MRDNLTKLHHVLTIPFSLFYLTFDILQNNLLDFIKRHLFCKLAYRILSLLSWDTIFTEVDLDYLLYGIDKININFSLKLRRRTEMLGFVHVSCLWISDASLMYRYAMYKNIRKLNNPTVIISNTYRLTLLKVYRRYIMYRKSNS